MIKTAIIIPSRLDAQRLPNKPLKLINNKEMIAHVYEAAVKSNSGDVYVATPDQKIIDVIINNGGKAIKTSENHKTGTDRIFEVFEKILKKKTDIIINLQGDMPNINPQAINELVSYMKENRCDIATLASELNIKLELNNPNVVKVAVKENLSQKMFVNALDFVRSELNQNYKYYHHIGIYGFTNKALMRYVSLKRSKLEQERNLEQLRALENKMSIHVGYLKTSPLSVDTEEDLIEVKRLMKDS
tara:strand:+ start:4159 stop:4893 length:735 start_codon:yes stop_codon:yes gene_type:complete